MIKKRYILVALGVISVLLGSLLYSSVISAPGGEYDPWLDYNEDGIVDVNDLHSLSQVYSSSGDPTKNVNVTNWPVSHDVLVWYNQPMTGTANLFGPTPYANASGYGRLHILVYVDGLGASEQLNLWVYGLLFDLDHTSYYSVVAHSVIFTSTLIYYNATLDVPSEHFRFRIFSSPLTTCSVYLSYYLTQ